MSRRTERWAATPRPVALLAHFAVFRAQEDREAVATQADSDLFVPVAVRQGRQGRLSLPSKIEKQIDNRIDDRIGNRMYFLL